MALTGQSYFDSLLGDQAVADMLGPQADMAALLQFEVALAKAQADHGLIEPAAAQAIEAMVAGFEPDLARLTAATLKDGVPVPDLVAQMRQALKAEHGKALHFGATSQDAIDTALALMLKPVFELLGERLAVVDVALADLFDHFGTAPLMARSRMQAAIMIEAGDRITVWRRAVSRAGRGLDAERQAMLIVTLAGAAGTAEKFGDKIAPVRQAMAEALGLVVPDYVPHTDRGRIADFAGFLSRITGALGKIGQDVALMAQNGIGQITISGGGGSSAMPHKQNPVRAEVLVALARYNAVQLSAIHLALVHEQERSGSAWMLEWMVLPKMIEATATALAHTASMLQSVERIGEPG
ncbi:MAG: 3-carboxy-cis,cis-muconate cycloisomerase [Allorhizobium sp.]